MNMDIQILGSGSSGNCYIINDGKTNIMIDCGIGIREIKAKTNFFEPKIDGCLCTHGHLDHLLSAKDLMKLGIQCYMSEECMRESNINKFLLSMRATEIKHGEPFTIGTFVIKPLEMVHDVYCLGFLIYSNELKEALFFATDTAYIKYQIPPVEYIMVEANYDLDLLNSRIQAGDTNMAAKDRLIKSHMSIGATLKWLDSINLRKTKKIYLMHLSNGSANEKDFKQRVIELTGIPTQIC